MAVLLILFLIIVVLASFVGGILLIVASRPGGSGYPACSVCGYNLIGTIGVAARCPECGGNFSAVGITPPRGKQKPLRLALGILLILFPVSCVGCTLTGLVVPILGRSSPTSPPPPATGTTPS